MKCNRLFNIIILSFFLTACSEKSGKDQVRENLNYKVINSSIYKETITGSKGLMVLGYFSERDDVNRRYLDEFNKFAGSLKDSVGFYVVNIDKDQNLAKENGIKCIPSYKIFFNGVPERTLNGSLDSIGLWTVMNENPVKTINTD